MVKNWPLLQVGALRNRLGGSKFITIPRMVYNVIRIVFGRIVFGLAGSDTPPVSSFQLGVPREPRIS